MKRILAITLMLLLIVVGAAHAEDVPFDYKLTATPNAWPAKGERVSFKIEVKNTSDSDLYFSVTSSGDASNSLTSAKVSAGKKAKKSFPYTISEDEAASGTVELVISYTSGSVKGEVKASYNWPVPVTPKPTTVPKPTLVPTTTPEANNLIVGNKETAFEYVTKFCSNYNILSHESGLSDYNHFGYIDAFDFEWDELNQAYSCFNLMQDASMHIDFDSNYCAKSYSQFIKPNNTEHLRIAAVLLIKSANWSLEEPEKLVDELIKEEHMSDFSYYLKSDDWSYSVISLGSSYLISADKYVQPYIIQFDKNAMKDFLKADTRPAAKTTATPVPTSEWPSLKASSVKYNYANSVGKDFYLSGYGELRNYFNYAYDDYEEDYFCMKVEADDGSRDTWYIYFHRDSFEELYEDALLFGEIRLEMKCNITKYQKGQDDMAQALRVRWWN